MDRWRVAIASVVLMVSGCSAAATGPATPSPRTAPSPTPPAPEDAGVIAWSSQTPVPSAAAPTPTASPAAPPCASDQLRAGDAHGMGATGSILIGFPIRNTAATPCRLDRVEGVVIVDGDGRPLDVVPIPAPGRAAVVLAPGRPEPVEGEDAPAGLALMTLVWRNWCDDPPKGPLGLRVTLSDGGRLETPLGTSDTTPRCDASGSGSELAINALEATEGPSPTDPPAIPADYLTVSLVVPDEAVAGRTLRYVAVLTNRTSDAIALEPCPDYRESLDTHGGDIVATYVLACARVPEIAAGASIRFAMELVVPATLAPDPGAALVWELDPYLRFPPGSPGMKVALPVVAP